MKGRLVAGMFGSCTPDSLEKFIEERKKLLSEKILSGWNDFS